VREMWVVVAVLACKLIRKLPHLIIMLCHIFRQPVTHADVYEFYDERGSASLKIGLAGPPANPHGEGE
jgi:hypothetical protein